ncbi:acyltransferase family protein [Actinomadura hibisca]|uniref:acyltransferase family protein n=1 Tax=Actinomadura hibisca TaxID=68565 RepID=UPI00082D3D49|nr:acyltransferase [Actinomadura hibisca]
MVAGTLAPAVHPTTPTVPRPRRLDWLDGLRGLAALVVVFEHTLNVLFPEIRHSASPWFDFGRYGVFVFFLVSGYIVPLSLERRGNVREFWVGRLFRLYPLAAVAALLGVLLAVTAVAWPLPSGVTERPWVTALAHLTMLQDLLGTPNVVNVFWTLSYEMVFYLLITALFVAGVRRASAGIAAGFAAGAVLVGALLPTALLAGWSQAGTVLGAAVLMAGGLLAVMSRGRAARRAGCVTLALLALVLLAFNNRVGGTESLAIIATMFAGSALQEIQQGRLPRVRATLLAALVPLLTVAGGVRAAVDGQGEWGWPVAVAAAWLTFLLGLAARHRRIPRPLPWLGVISYSIYLLHQPIVQIVWRLTGDPEQTAITERIAWAVVLVGCVLGASALTYRYVELPMQRLGRRVARRPSGEAARGPLHSPVWTSGTRRG